MKTPEEIKKGLNVLYPPSSRTTYSEYVEAIACIPDALAYIEQLKRERDAAVEILRSMHCDTCIYDAHDPIPNDCLDCVNYCNWEWRGVKEKKDENTREY